MGKGTQSIFSVIFLSFFGNFPLVMCVAILEEPENEYDTEATKKAKDLYASCVDIRKYVCLSSFGSYISTTQQS